MSPTFYDMMKIQWLRISLELKREFSHSPFPLIQILFEGPIHFIFVIINIKNQSEESSFLCVSHLNIFFYFLLYFSLYRALPSSAPLTSLHLSFTFNYFWQTGKFAYLVNSPKSIEIFKAQYGISQGVSIRYCKQGDWYAQRQEREVVIPMIAFIEGGMRIPMGKVTRDYLIAHRLAPTQCAPTCLES